MRERFEMKKKILSILLALVMTVSVTACGNRTIVSTDLEDSEKAEDSRDDKDGEDKKDTADKDDKEDEDKEQDRPRHDHAASGVVLGGEFEDSYDGFTYLSCETLRTDAYGEEESKKLQVFVPEDDYFSVYGNTVYAEALGVSLCVTLDPYLQYEAEQYTAAENLDVYLDSEFNEFYTASYKGFEMSEAETTGSGARATVNYCNINTWDNSYYTVYSTYYLAELSDVSVLVEVEVRGDETERETTALLDELSQFYGFEIDWDEAVSEKKLSDLIASGERDRNVVSMGFLLCELPAGWYEDYTYYDSGDYTYAPDGAADEAGCLISFSYEYMGTEAFSLEEEFQNLEELKDALGVDTTDFSAEYIGMTGLGETGKISYKQTDEENEDILYIVILATNGDYAYTIQAGAVQSCAFDIEKILEDAVSTAKVRY